MKNKSIFITIFLITIMSYGQEKTVDSIKAIHSYIKTEYTITINGKEFPVYLSKNKINYFIKRIDEKTGREYWQLLDKIDNQKKTSR